MSREYLYKSYYYNNTEEIEEFLKYYSNCTFKCMYLIMKNKSKVSFDPYNIFFEDFTFRVRIVRPEGCVYLCDKLYDNNAVNRICKSNYYQKINDRSAILLMEELLEKGEIVIGMTVNDLLPFLTYYNPDINIEEKMKSWYPGHPLLFIHIDKDHVYYVEEQHILNKNHVAFEGNPDIGVADRKLIEDVFSLALVCFTIDVDENALEAFKINLQPIIENMEYYTKEYEVFDDAVDWYGRNALKKIIQMCEGKDNSYVIGNLYDSNDSNLFRTTISKRRVLSKWVLKYLNNSILSRLIDECINKWELTRKIIIDRKYMNINYLDMDVRKYFEDLLHIEDEIHYSLKEDSTLSRYLADEGMVKLNPN